LLFTGMNVPECVTGARGEAVA